MSLPWLVGLSLAGRDGGEADEELGEVVSSGLHSRAVNGSVNFGVVSDHY